MRLRHIEVFSAIMRTGSTNGAAKLLHVSQPSISQTLQHAEQTLGFALFVRRRNKLVATPEAKALYLEMEPIDEQLLRIRRLADGLRRGAMMPVRLAATPAIAHHLLPAPIAQWTRLHTDCRCDVVVSHTREIVHALVLNETDLGLTMQPPEYPGIVATPVRQGELCAIAPAGWWSPDQLGQPLAADDFAGQPMIAIDVQDYLGTIIATWLAEVHPVPRVTLSVQTYTLARSLVEAGCGIAIVDSFTANHAVRTSGMQVRKLDLAQPLNVYALTMESRAVSKAAQNLLQMIAETGPVNA
ncbi:LysR family transcriptional regulator [Noviherbaspirillum sp.]|uniref:LysR family transcriptional regulator n=1 Tax=Noviherbaspirillum sp. TaxID=1926288 RepID=UPI002FE37DD2